VYIVVKKFGSAFSKKPLGIYLKRPTGNKTKFKYLKKTRKTISIRLNKMKIKQRNQNSRVEIENQQL
jgi:hypothetical protein